MTEREGRGRAQVRDPAQAIAMAKCWLATWTKRAGMVGLPPVNSFHMGTCAFCELPRDLLVQMLEEFRDWAGVSSYSEEVPLRLEMEQWESLPGHEQARLIAKAQAAFGAKEEPPDTRSPW